MKLISPRQKQGQTYEAAARDYLIKQGLKLVTCNYSSCFGEVDLIMREREQLIFVEVRYRKNVAYGGGLASITRQKQQKIMNTALCYLKEQRLVNKANCRFDVIAIDNQHEFVWIKAAFMLE